ncbi:MAG: IS630 family transposase, partial [Deltaproteobacteria bacterium]|nr:IS630 family transposase [Deltaproteobacteria bacterium]
IAFRAQVVLLHIYEGRSVSATARLLGTTRSTVTKWSGRYRLDPTLRGLADASRSGRCRRITARDEAVVMELACRTTESLGRLEVRMTQPLIVEEAAKRDVHLSRSSVQRILARAEVKPHRNRYYLFTPKNEPEYEIRRDAICNLYMGMCDLPPDEIVVCLDEKTGMQALGRPHPGLPTAPGRVRLTEHNYIRYGSRSLVAAIRPDTGELVVGKLYLPRCYKTAQAIEMLLAITAALPGYRVIHLVWDNASTHRSKEMRAFLGTELGSRFRLYYTPTHASWLDLAENFFSRFSNRYHRGGRYESLVQFEEHINACLAAYNSTAKPIQWRYNPSADRMAA